MPPASPVVLPATLPDVPAIVALVDAAYRGDSSRQGWTTEADLLDGQRTDAEEVTEAVTGAGSRMLVVELGGRAVGCCHVALRPDQTAYFGMFAVDPAQQGRGIGRLLLAEAERVAVAEGASRMRMTVIGQRRDLIAWYERLGYTPTGERQPFPYGDDRFGLPRRPDLEFVVLARALAGAGLTAARTGR